jgi:hypothetical protein
MFARLPNKYDVPIVDRVVGLKAQLTGGGPAA